MAPPEATAMDYTSTEELINIRPLPFTSAHNRLIESSNLLPRGALNKAYREAFGTRVNDVIRDLLERTRLDQEVDLRTAFNGGTSSSVRTPPQRRGLLQGGPPSTRTTSAERLAQVNNSSIRRSPTSPHWAQQQGRQPAAAVQRGGTPSAPRRPRAYNTDLGESFRRAAAQRAGGSGNSSVFGSAPPSLSIYGSPEERRAAANALLQRSSPGTRGQSSGYRSAAVEEVSDSSDDGEEDASVRVSGFRRGKHGDNATSSTFGASSTLPRLPRELLTTSQQPHPAGSTKKANVSDPASAPQYRKSKFAEDLDSLLPSRPVSVQRPLFGNAPRPETTTKRRNWVGGLFGSKEPAAASKIPISTSKENEGGLFGNAPATPAPISPPGGGIFGPRSSSASFDSNYGAGDGLGDLDEQTIEAIRLARRAAAGRGGSGPSPNRRGKYGLSCFTSAFSSSKKNQSKNSSRPLPQSPDFAPRYAGYTSKNTFGGHAEINGVHRSALKRSNAIRDAHRNTGAQGVAGVSGVHRTERVDTRRAGTGRPRYFAPHPDLRPQSRGQRQAPVSGDWLASGYGRSRR